jgi:hypothetical protein
MADAGQAIKLDPQYVNSSTNSCGQADVACEEGTHVSFRSMQTATTGMLGSRMTLPMFRGYSHMSCA